MLSASADDKIAVHTLVSAACEAQKRDRRQSAMQLLDKAEKVVIQLSARGESSYARDAWNEVKGMRSSLGL